jgi:hypothetical protein
MKPARQIKDYTCKAPCKNCPYRKDAPLRLWDVKEYFDLLNSENDYFGEHYACHKKNGHTCVGWLMNQDERNLPSIALRMSLSKNGVTREYLDSLRFDVPRYETIQEMAFANYPALKRLIK